jgi:hypothetical protein
LRGLYLRQEFALKRCSEDGDCASFVDPDSIDGGGVPASATLTIPGEVGIEADL